MIFTSGTEDFSKRDAAIRINSYTTVRKRTSITRDVFNDYWRDVHGPLCARLPGLSWYVQHHFAAEHDGHLWPIPEGVLPFEGYVPDGIVEIGFENETDQKRFKQASPLLFSDEQNIFDESVAYSLPKGSRTYVDKFPDPVPNGCAAVDLIHVHFHASHGDADLFHSATSHFAKALATSNEVLKVRLHLPEPHDNRKVDPPAPNVSHDVPPDRVLLAMLEIAFETPLSRRTYFASKQFVELQKALLAHISRIAAFSVEGVYTYTRDSMLTTAGLRGSRAAELIRSLGAINQLEPDVQKIMFAGAL